MDTPRKAEPAIYPKMRESALQWRRHNLSNDSVHVVLMDWNVSNGTCSVMAAADGSASIYLSSGGGYIGGGQKFSEIREAALQAVRIAPGLLSQFERTETIDLPGPGKVYFYLTTNAGIYRAVATEAKLSAGIDPLGSLGAIMQEIITRYRLNFPRPSAS
jgi:hypothetical protein